MVLTFVCRLLYLLMYKLCIEVFCFCMHIIHRPSITIVNNLFHNKILHLVDWTLESTVVNDKYVKLIHGKLSCITKIVVT